MLEKLSLFLVSVNLNYDLSIKKQIPHVLRFFQKPYVCICVYMHYCISVNIYSEKCYFNCIISRGNANYYQLLNFKNVFFIVIILTTRWRASFLYKRTTDYKLQITRCLLSERRRIE